MDDSRSVRLGEPIGDLRRHAQHTADRHERERRQLAQRLAFDELHRDEGDISLPPDLVNRHDVRMVQRRGRAGLLLEPGDPVPIQGQGLRQNLDRHVAAELRILRPVYLSHPTRTQGRQDLEAAEASAGGECHEKTVTAILAASLVETCSVAVGFPYNRADTARAGDSAMDPRFRRVAFALTIWAGALGLCAQTLPSTGSIYGTALDEQGSSLPGVEVKLLGAGERAPVQTDSQGRFRFLYISPGTYAVTLSLDGFATVENQGVVVALDRSTQLRVTMKLAAVNETMTVLGAPAIDPRKTVTGATFEKKELQSIPSARNIWATLWAVPGVVTNQVNVGGNTAVQASPSSKGVTGATYNLDGADITLGGISPTFYNFDSFQEVQVVTGGSDVTLLNGGATFNMVTRRGTNALHGSARYFYAPNRWQTENTPAEVNLAGLSTNRTNVLRDYGVEAGGAVLSDRIWLWGAWGKNQIDLQKLGQLDTEGRQVNENSTLENFDARLDAQLAASNSLELYYHHGDRVQYGRGVDINTAPESGFDLTQPVPIYKIADTHVFSPSLTATAFFSYMDFVQTATPVGGVDTPAYIDANQVLAEAELFRKPTRSSARAEPPPRSSLRPRTCRTSSRSDSDTGTRRPKRRHPFPTGRSGATNTPVWPTSPAPRSAGRRISGSEFS